jgi:L-amino acid N-acyltransferase YncA
MTQGREPDTILVRPSIDADVADMLWIYRHHACHGVGDTGGYEPARFDAEDLKARRKNMRKHRLPHLVAIIDGQVAGYAYVVPFRKRPAYRYTVKHSIYVHPERLGCGVGRALLAALIEACAAAGYRQLIGYIDGGNAASLKLHETFDFAVVGRLPAVAYRFDHWAETVMVQRALGPGGDAPPSPWGPDGPITD